MGRKIHRPISQRFGEREISRVQDRFSDGMIGDEAPSEIPHETSMWRIYDSIAYPHEIRGRTGSTLWADTDLPALGSVCFNSSTVRYRLEKNGNVITSHSGAIFDEGWVGRWIIWPDNTQSEIVQYLSGTQVLADESVTSHSVCRAYARGRVCVRDWHKTQRRVITQLETELWYSDYRANSYTKLIKISHEALRNAQSDWDEFDKYGLVFNGGIFKVVLDTEFPYYYRINTPIPTTRVTSNDRQGQLTKCRQYLYSMVRLTQNQNIRTRETNGVITEQESGTVAYDPATYRDYGEVWTRYSVGDGSKTYGVITGAAIAAADMDPSAWGLITNGSFIFTRNSIQETIYVDFTAVTTMADVADRIQLAIQSVFPDATCEFDEDHFVFTSGRVDGSTLDWLVAAAAGTDISDNLLCRNGDGGTLSNTGAYERESEVGVFELPVSGDDVNEKQWHWTHYRVYGNLDQGPDGTDPQTGEANSPLFTWVHDLRVCGAFWARSNKVKTPEGAVSGDIIEALYGMFEPADVGTVLEWEDGARETIIEYIDPTHVRIEQAYYGGTYTGYRACAIGNGRVLRASQTGNIVTAEVNSFLSTDVGRPIMWSMGHTSYICEYIAPGSVRVYDSTERVTQGITLDPQYRNFCDTKNDDALRAQIEADSLMLISRFWRPLPLSNVGAVVPNFLVAGRRNQKDWWYSQVLPTQKYFGGYYHPTHHTNEDCEDGIQEVRQYTNKILFFCQNKWYAGPTNSHSTVVSAGITLVKFLGLQFGGNVGLFDYGSYYDIDDDAGGMITSDQSAEVFDGYNFSGNLAEDKRTGMEKVMDELRSWIRATASIFVRGKHGGFMWWGKR